MALTDATFCHPAAVPETVGRLGAVRSSCTVSCTAAEVKPASSTARKRTRVSPSAVTVSEPPVTHADQLAPPSSEVERS